MVRSDRALPARGQPPFVPESPRARRSTNVTAEALGSIRLVTSNFSAEMWENMNLSVSEQATTTAQDAFLNARNAIDASATDVSLGAGDTLDFVAQNKAAMLTTDFWLAAGHALDVFAQVRRARRPRSSAGVHPGVFCNRARARSRSGGRLHIRR